MQTEGNGSPTRNLTTHRILFITLGFELGLGVLAIALALMFGMTPWLDLQWNQTLVPVAAAATIPMIGLIVLVDRAGWNWAVNLRRLVDETLLPLFSGLGWWALGLISLAAGIGEELLFRGVVQNGLADIAGPTIALLTAAVLFGLAHALTPAYFVLTTLAGLYLGGLYIATGNLLAPTLVHFGYDWIALTWLLKRSGATAA